jgi:uncharacterized protein
MRRLLCALLRAYQLVVSPLLGAHCRFYPSCSAYAKEAIEIHGAWLGVGLAARRLCKCHPYHSGGYDPVPARAGSAPGTGPHPADSLLHHEN